MVTLNYYSFDKILGSQYGTYTKLNNYYREVIDYCFEFYKHSNLKASTIQNRISGASNIFHYFQTLGYESFSNIEENTVVSYFVRDSKPLFSSSRRRSLHSILIAASSKYPECVLIASWIPCIKYSRKNIQYLTDIERDKLISSCENSDNLTCMEKAIGNILIYLGLRACDIAGLGIDDVDWNLETIHIKQNKTNISFELPLLPEVGNSVLEYIEKERQSNSKYLFVRKNGKPIKVFDVYKCASTLFDVACIRMNKGDRRGTHIFRHKVATKLLENKTPLPVISQTLGHTNPNSVQTYLNADIKHTAMCALDISMYPLNWEKN